MRLKFKSREAPKPGMLQAGPQGDGAAEPVLPPESEMSFLDHLEELADRLSALGDQLATGG